MTIGRLDHETLRAIEELALNGENIDRRLTELRLTAMRTHIRIAELKATLQSA